MKRTGLIAAVALTLAYAGLRLMTLSATSPTWATLLQPVLLGAALVSMSLSGQMNFTRRSLWDTYKRKAHFSLLMGLVGLILMPLIAWLFYSHYYVPLMSAMHSGE